MQSIQKRIRRISLVFLLFYTQLSGCAPILEKGEHKILPNTCDTSRSVAFETPVGVALVLHGLNLRPSAMDDIAGFLSDNGLEVVRLSLKGHSEDERNADLLEQFKSVSLPIWRQETMCAYLQAAEIAQRKNLPLVLVGFSLGGALGLDLTTQLQRAAFDKQILFAPAIDLKATSYLLAPLTIFPSLVIPSFSSKKFRVNEGTPMAAYGALYALVSDLEQSVDSNHNMETLLFIDDDDELVSASGLENFMADKGFDRWTIYRVTKTQETSTSLNHLMISEETVGRKTWLKMTNRMRNFLNPAL